jgi:hypothetical protein
VSAFTDRVTHLVAVDHGGAKYMVGGASCSNFRYHSLRPQCALERKIPILQPSWITDSYQTWLRGDDVDLQKVRNTEYVPHRHRFQFPRIRASRVTAYLSSLEWYFHPRASSTSRDGHKSTSY